MHAVSVIPSLGSVAVASTSRVERPRAIDDRDGSPEGASAEERSARGVVYAFRARPAAVRDHRRGHADDGGLDPDRGARRGAFAGRGPGGTGTLLPESPDEAPLRLGDFAAGSALEAQLLTPALRRIHAAVMARRAE